MYQLTNDSLLYNNKLVCNVPERDYVVTYNSLYAFIDKKNTRSQQECIVVYKGKLVMEMEKDNLEGIIIGERVVGLIVDTFPDEPLDVVQVVQHW